jgi:hypothetical protein
MSNACLNCGASLHGPFCSACGQRAVPRDPSVSELAGDAWQELSGYDGRVAATVRGLFRPGFLTHEYMAGRRARYLSPVRLYLIVSVIYFVVAAAAPNLTTRPGELNMPGGVRIGVASSNNVLEMSDEDRKTLLASAERAPSLVRPLMVAVAKDPAGLRARVLTIMPRVFFALLPVFAAIVAVFYRGRRFPTALVFATHLHAFAFTVFALSEASKLTRSIPVAVAVSTVVTIGFAAYALVAARRVFGGGWLITIVKAVGVGAVYLVASLPAFALIFVWAVLW